MVTLVALAAFGSVWADDVVLARRGTQADCSIVLPQGASACSRYAAEELQRYVKRLTQVELPIVTRAEALPGKAIVISYQSDQPLGEDGFRLRVSDDRLHIEGGTRGVLFGVYELLERFGGCRWYASWHTVVPRRATFAVPDALDVMQKPDIAVRASWWFDVIRHNDFAARLRLNTHPWGVVEPKYGGDAFKFSDALPNCHTFDTLIPPAKYRKDHPEYFSRVPGKRTQPCLTNPDVLAIVTSNVLHHVRKDPESAVFGVSQNDWLNFCTCDDCTAVDNEEGSHAGSLVRFVNAVAEVVSREAPGKMLETLAYQYTRRPPKLTRLSPNVVPCLCSIECDFAFSIPESDYAENKSFREDLAGWRAMTDHLYIWDYVTNFRHYPLPFPNVYALQGNMRFFRDNGAKVMFPEGAYQGNLGDFAELKAWLLAKLMWNADAPLDELLDDFFNGHYGKAAPFVRTYFEELHQLRRADRTHPLLIYERAEDPVLSDAFLARAAHLFDQARAAVKDEPAVYRKAVEGTAFSVDYTQFLRFEAKSRHLLWFRHAAPSGDGQEAQAARAKRMLATMKLLAPARLSESAYQHEKEVAAIRAAAVTQPALTRATRGEVEEKDLNFYGSADMGALVDDPLAGDGRALKLTNTHFEWSTDFRLKLVAVDPGSKVRLRVRCRVELKPNASGEVFWAGVYDMGTRKETCSVSVPAERVKDSGYAWYEVGTFTPNDDQTFWIGPGRFDKDGKSRIEALYVDKIDLSLIEE